MLSNDMLIRETNGKANRYAFILFIYLLSDRHERISSKNKFTPLSIHVAIRVYI